VWYLINIYNTVGALYVEGLMSLEEVVQLYSPGWVIGWYEMFEFLIKRLRFNNRGEAVYPEYMTSFKRLYGDLRQVSWCCGAREHDASGDSETYGSQIRLENLVSITLSSLPTYSSREVNLLTWLRYRPPMCIDDSRCEKHD
jgi:hypothetical protein